MKRSKLFIILFLILMTVTPIAGCTSANPNSSKDQETTVSPDNTPDYADVSDSNDPETLSIIDEYEVVTEENQAVGGF